MKKIFYLLFISILLIGCSFNKEMTPATSTSFSDALTSNSFSVNDNSGNYAGSTYILEAYSGNLNDVTIEYIKYDSIESAKTVLEDHMSSFNMLKSTAASEKNEIGKNYQKYILISNNYYMSSIRVENTLVFCKTNLNNKDIVEKVYEKLGY